jgi:Photosynthetic reaction centre cytochrome C subunit
MFLKKKALVILSFAGGIGICVSASTHPANEFKNLKVLPKNISSKQLSAIMVDDFTDGLGVSCSFCHVENKDTHKFDYASDDNIEKNRARKMMLMAAKINKSYFEVRHPVIGDSSLVITCYTCHRGTVYPDSQ